MKIFLSHISSEKKLAIVLKEWIESTFLGNIDVFVSSDIEDIPSGNNWLNTIDSALNDSSLFIVLCSKTSIGRPWINFETGCGWIKKVPIMPICHSGLSKNDLPKPIELFQALELNEELFLDSFLKSIAKHCGINKIPKIDQLLFMKEIGTALNSIVDSNTTEIVTEKKSDELSEELISVLSILGKNGFSKTRVSQIAGNLNVSIEKAKYYLGELRKCNYVNFIVQRGVTDTEYYLQQEGRRILVEKGLL